MFRDATPGEINEVMQSAWNAFHTYRKCSLKERADLMRTIAKNIEALGEELIKTAAAETHLSEARLKIERSRTLFQLTSYATACEKGDWLEARIDTAVPGSQPPKPDIRKMLVALGPVVVFGAANFPFAYSTAGGDTACAFAAGCPVIVKAHPAHVKTSELVATAISRAVIECRLPQGVFAHVHGVSFETGRALVTHELTKAVGFTGSFTGGKQLFDWANQRKEPIPVFAEMSSVNPVFLFPEKLQTNAVEIAKQYTTSITNDAGQFCTKPGLLIGIEGDGLQQFVETLSAAIRNIPPGSMLHPGIYKNYIQKRTDIMVQNGVEIASASDTEAHENQAAPTLAVTTGNRFLNNRALQQEVFGPFSLVIRCRDMEEMTKVAQHIDGQLTASLMATNKDIKNNEALIELIKNKCGRFILNGVPTGVTVSLGMQHGGPFPATTDPRFTSVGADGIARFARPLAFQNWNDELLPDALKNENPLHIWRTVNNELTKDPISDGNQAE